MFYRLIMITLYSLFTGYDSKSVMNLRPYDVHDLIDNVMIFAILNVKYLFLSEGAQRHGLHLSLSTYNIIFSKQYFNLKRI